MGVTEQYVSTMAELELGDEIHPDYYKNYSMRMEVMRRGEGVLQRHMRQYFKNISEGRSKQYLRREWVAEFVAALHDYLMPFWPGVQS